MPKTAKATLDGIELLGSSLLHWRIDSGTQPHHATFDIAPSDLNRFLGAPKPVDLIIEPGDGTPRIKVSNLYVIGNSPGPHKHISRVEVVDRRYWWSYNFISRRYNMRRKVAPKRLINPATPPEVWPIVPDIIYAPYSLRNNTQVWKADQILRDVIEAVLKTETETYNIKANYRIEAYLNTILRRYPVENLMIDDYGDEAIAQALKILPEIGVTVDYDGTIRFYSKASGLEKTVVEQEYTHETVGGGHVEIVDNRNIRPRYIDVLFTREIETRFDFKEVDPIGDAARERFGAANEERFTDNVLPVPDYELKMVSGRYKGFTVCQGTWVRVTDALDAWNAEKTSPVELTLDMVRKAMVPFLDLWGAMQYLGLSDPDNNWVARIAALQAHYRRTFRVNRRWVDRYFQMKDYRVATLDPVTGQRAPAGVYANYAYLGSQRSRFKEIDTKGNSAESYVINILGYPASDKIDPDTRNAAGAVAKILDHDQGIVQIDFRGDPFRMYEQILPSWVVAGEADPEAEELLSKRPKIAGPTPNIEQKRLPISFDSVFQSSVGDLPRLVRQHKASIIMTLIPGSPNNDTQLHRIRVFPEDIIRAELLPNAQKEGLTAAHGPPMELRVGPGVETARIAWIDDRARDIERLFTNEADQVNVDNLVINLLPGQSETAGSIKDIANAMAAVAYAGLVDRYHGMRHDHLKTVTLLEGYINSIGHMVHEKGEVLSSIAMADRPIRFNVFSQMGASTRNIVMKIANQGKIT